VYNSDQLLYAATMAMCALASARVRDGAVFSTRWQLEDLKEPRSEEFYHAARKMIPIEMVNARDHNAMRTYALLAITAIQYGKIREMHQHIGKYHTLVAMDGLHDEANWPRDIGVVEIEERRRLVRVLCPHKPPPPPNAFKVLVDVHVRHLLFGSLVRRDPMS
jgi:hypothetical protein